jgi:hypothetical protein
MARTFSSPAAFRQALEQRLKTVAGERNVPLNTLRLKLLIERLLARLFAQPNPPWLLKGGYAMELRYRPKARTTQDIDLAVGADERVAGSETQVDRIREELQTEADVDLGDNLKFLIAAARTELLGAPDGGARFPVEARMAGRIFGKFHIDVGIGDALHGTPERLQGEDLLAFAGIRPAEVLAISPAQQFAEKVHAYTFPWTDRANTRSRDLVDMVLLIEAGNITPEEASAAVKATFHRRRTHDIPTALPDPPANWVDEFAGMATETQIEAATLTRAAKALNRFWADVSA